MADQDDVRRIALSLPGARQLPGRFAFSVEVKGKDKEFAWVWMERVDPKKARVPQPAVLVVRVADEAEKQALLAADGDKFFTEPHYDGYPGVLVRLAKVTKGELGQLLADAHRTRAPAPPRRTRRPPLTPALVADLVDGRIPPEDGAPPSYHTGMRRCRDLPASLIRDSVRLLRTRRGLEQEARALAAAVSPDETDDAKVVAAWRSAIDGLRVLYGASPVGTARQRGQLLGVARDGRLVAAMRAALAGGKRLDPPWAAVLAAEGSAASVAALAPHLRRALRSKDRGHLERWGPAVRGFASTPAMVAALDAVVAAAGAKRR